MIFTAKFNYDESFKLDFESQLNSVCIWVLVINFSYFSDYGHPSHFNGWGKGTEEQIPLSRGPECYCQDFAILVN